MRSLAGGRRRILLLGWLAVLPIPPLVRFASDRPRATAAPEPPGFDQGLNLSRWKTAKFDLMATWTHCLVIELYGFSRSLGMAIAIAFIVHLAPSG